MKIDTFNWLAISDDVLIYVLILFFGKGKTDFTIAQMIGSCKCKNCATVIKLSGSCEYFFVGC